ncbi:MAG TPA: DUF4870 domain-containing protein [Candidatus Binataceae bacterium]|jgi:uncharacterized membrane protein|nr:DUF4870 domain-containing protein [Candidatus Binataceae bacterium]
MDAQSGTPQNQVIAALAYVLGLVTGIVFLYLEPYDRDDYVRFHARQSIAFSVAWLVINVIFGVFIAVLPYSLGRLLGGLQELVNLALAVMWIFLMWKALRGERYRIPYLADITDGFAGAS